MKALFWIGMVVVILGIVSLFVPVPHNERTGIKIGGLSAGIETQHEQMVSPYVSAAMIVAGGCMAAAGKLKS